MNKLHRYCSGTPTLTSPSSDGHVSVLAHMGVRNSSSGGGRGREWGTGEQIQRIRLYLAGSVQFIGQVPTVRCAWSVLMPTLDFTDICSSAVCSYCILPAYYDSCIAEV